MVSKFLLYNVGHFPKQNKSDVGVCKIENYYSKLDQVILFLSVMNEIARKAMAVILVALHHYQFFCIFFRIMHSGGIFEYSKSMICMASFFARKCCKRDFLLWIFLQKPKA